MDYRTTVAAIRSARVREMDELQARARRELADAMTARDAEIRRLRSAGLSYQAIAANVGCSAGTVIEILMDPERRKAYVRRRRAHWHVYAERRAAETRRERSERSHAETASDGGLSETSADPVPWRLPDRLPVGA